MRVYRGERRSCVAAALAVWGGTVAAPCLAQPSFQILTTMPNGTGGGVMYGLSADGTTAVGSAGTFEPGAWRAFRWRLDTGVVENIGIFPAGLSGTSHAAAVSADGGAIAGFSLDNTTTPGNTITRAFRWTAATGMVEIPDFPGGGRSITATGISGDGGTVVGYGAAANELPAFRWSQDGGLMSLGTLPGVSFVSAAAHGISLDGQVIVGDAETHMGTRAFRWTQGSGMVDLGTAGWQFSNASAASADGSVVVGTAGRTGSDGEPIREGFRWTEETGMVRLGSLTHPIFDFSYSEATGVNADGSMIIGNGYGGWVWTAEGGMVPVREYLLQHGIEVGPYSIFSLDGVSADGRVIVGTANDVMGFPVAWAATIPAPSPVCLGASAAILLTRRRRVPSLSTGWRACVPTSSTGTVAQRVFNEGLAPR